MLGSEIKSVVLSVCVENTILSLEIGLPRGPGVGVMVLVKLGVWVIVWVRLMLGVVVVNTPPASLFTLTLILPL